MELCIEFLFFLFIVIYIDLEYVHSHIIKLFNSVHSRHPNNFGFSFRADLVFLSDS